MAKYNIAILMPTRGRTDMLKRSIDSLLDNASNVKRIQLMLGFDRDDTDAIIYFKTVIRPELDARGAVYKAIQFNPLGYVNINRYGNVLAEHAEADWYMFFNDDAIMETKNWDLRISERTGEFKLLAVHTHNDHPYSIFPIVPAVWMTILGHLSPHQMIDAWLSQVAYMLDIMDRVEIYVEHDRHDLTGNNKDDTFKQRVCLEGRPHDPNDFHYIDWTLKRMHECEALAKYMQSINVSTKFWEAVKAGTQDPWEKLKDFDVNSQMVQYNVKWDKDKKPTYDVNPKNAQKLIQPM